MALNESASGLLTKLESATAAYLHEAEIASHLKLMDLLLHEKPETISLISRSMVEQCKKFEFLKGLGGNYEIPVFQIAKKDKSGQLYLAGSAHFGSKRTVSFMKKLTPIIEKCDSVTFETDVKQVDPIVFFQLSMSNPDFRQTLQLLKDSTSIAQQIAGEMIDGYGVETIMRSHDAVKGKHFSYLEKPADQLNALAALKHEAMSPEQRYLLTHLEGLKILQVLELVFRKSCARAQLNNLRDTTEVLKPDETEVLFRQREKRWLPQIEKILDSKDTPLVVVGALHLYGENGLLSVLKNRGYQVKPA